MYTLTVTNPRYERDVATKFEAASASEAYALQTKFEAMDLDVHVQDDSDLNKEGCYDGGFYDEDTVYSNLDQNN